MGSPVFGFSVGDFIAGIKLATEVYRACKEQGGAVSKSEATIRELETYCKVLEKLEQDSTHWASSELKEKASDLLSVCQSPLEEFKVSILKRWSKAAGTGKRIDSLQHASRHFNSFYRKAKWALSDAKEVEKLRAQIAPSVTALGLLVNMEIRFFVSVYLTRNRIDMKLDPSSTRHSLDKVSQIKLLSYQMRK